MFQANILTKTLLDDGRLNVQVEFTDGEKSFVQDCIPQNQVGLTYWVNQRLNELNFAKEGHQNLSLETEAVVMVDVTEEARNLWLNKLNRLNRIQNNLVKTGLRTGDEKEIQDLKVDLENTYDPDYLNFI